MMNFRKNGGPNGVLSKFQSVGIEELDEMINFRSLSEGRMSPESGRKTGSRPELLWRERERRRRKGKGEREKGERDREMADLI